VRARSVPRAARATRRVRRKRGLIFRKCTETRRYAREAVRAWLIISQLHNICIHAGAAELPGIARVFRRQQRPRTGPGWRTFGLAVVDLCAADGDEGRDHSCGHQNGEHAGGCHFQRVPERLSASSGSAVGRELQAATKAPSFLRCAAACSESVPSFGAALQSGSSSSPAEWTAGTRLCISTAQQQPHPTSRDAGLGGLLLLPPPPSPPLVPPLHGHAASRPRRAWRPASQTANASSAPMTAPATRAAEGPCLPAAWALLPLAVVAGRGVGGGSAGRRQGPEARVGGSRGQQLGGGGWSRGASCLLGPGGGRAGWEGGGVSAAAWGGGER
jgi:hypothetical protein